MQCASFTHSLQFQSKSSIENDKKKYFTPRSTFLFHAPIPVYEILGVKVQELHKGKSVEHLNVTLWTVGGKKPLASAYVIRVPEQLDFLKPAVELQRPTEDTGNPAKSWSEIPCPPNSKLLRQTTHKWHFTELPQTTPTYLDSSIWRFLYGGLFTEYLSDRKANIAEDAKKGSFLWGESRVPFLYQSETNSIYDISVNSETPDEFALPFLPEQQPLLLEDYVYSLCDSGSGISSQCFADGTWEFPNIDYNVFLYRKPEQDIFSGISGPVIGMKGNMEVNPDGCAIANTEIYDSKGIIGKSLQTVIVKKLAKI